MDVNVEEMGRRFEVCRQSGQVELDLSKLHLDEIPPQVQTLTKLQSLNLSYNNLGSLPEWLTTLTNLQSLDIARNNLGSLPEWLTTLINLQSLDIARNNLGNLPEWLATLTNLQSLNLLGNNLTNLPEWLATLTKLQSLNLSYNNLGNLPEWLATLTNLQSLNVSRNNLGSLPDGFGTLTDLQLLNLSINNLTNLPEWLATLTKLQSLNLSMNNLANLPEWLATLTKLQSLDVSYSNLGSLPEWLATLTNLRSLNLFGNNLIELPEWLATLTKLQSLDVGRNSLVSLPAWLADLPNLRYLFLYNNPLKDVPPELVGEPHSFAPIQTLLEYLSARRTGPIEPLAEVKVLVVGEAGTGKSAVVRRLVEDTFNEKRQPTPGVAIRDWPLPLDGRDIVLHLWDFAGQTITQNTHQLFLTIRSLYLLVLDSTQNEESNGLVKWLKTIHLYAPDAPVIVVLNKTDLLRLRLNQSALQAIHPVSAFVETSCFTGDGLPALRAEVEKALRGMQHLYDPVPATWMTVRRAVAADARETIPYSDFQTLCERYGVEDSADRIAEVLHYLGVLLTYRNDHALRFTHILDPNWVIDGIYPILSDHNLSQAGGFVTDDDIERILPPDRYPPEKHRVILGMMFTYQLAYELERGRYLVPDLLPKEAPAQTWEEVTALRFVYAYDFLPEGLFSRFVVQMKEEVDPALVWRTGVLLHQHGQPYAHILEEREGKRIVLSVRSTRRDARTLLDTLRDRFDKLHNNLKGLGYNELVPIPGTVASIAYQHLLWLESEGIDTYPFPETRTVLNVQELLDGISDPASRRRREATRRGDPALVSKTPSPVRLPKPMRVAAFFANPADHEYLRHQQAEERNVREILSRRTDFDVLTVTATRLKDLTAILDGERERLVLFHYSGHADDEGIRLEGEDGGNGRTITWGDLARELRHLRKLRLVLLNGCESLQDRFIKGFDKRHPAIIAMAAPIGDRKATIFARRFYESLAVGDSPETAHDKACNALRMEGFRNEADIPRYEAGQEV